MTNPATQMRTEVLEIPTALERMLSNSGAQIDEVVAALKTADPSYMATIARGSSDHAATCFKYVSEIMLGMPVVSLPPSIISIYDAPLKLRNCACMLISQSGQSPDLLAMAQRVRASEQLTFAVTNCPDSPCAKACDNVIDMNAGEELSVAATKTFVNSVIASLLVLAKLHGNNKLLEAIANLPEQLAKAATLDWAELRHSLDGKNSLFTIGRGLTLAMADEAALKFKETCQIHAESYSAAEALHGPVSLVVKNFPILIFAGQDVAEDSLAAAADHFASQEAAVFATTDKVKQASQLPFVRTGHWITDPLSLIVSFYAFIEKVASERGINPDQPRNLSKVTKTV